MSHQYDLFPPNPNPKPNPNPNPNPRRKKSIQEEVEYSVAYRHMLAFMEKGEKNHG